MTENPHAARSVNEIADELGITKQTVSKTEQRALGKLRAAIAKDPE